MEYDVSACNYFIRYETLEEDIKNMCKVLKIKNYDINNLPKHKSDTKRDSKNYRQYYDDELRRIVYRKHKKEIDLFGYKF